MRNMEGKYHVLPDPIILVSLDSLDPNGPSKGIPHGYAVEAESCDPSHMHTDPKLQKRLLELLNVSIHTHKLITKVPGAAFVDRGAFYKMFLFLCISYPFIKALQLH
jgi:hypothetical protein